MTGKASIRIAGCIAIGMLVLGFTGAVAAQRATNTACALDGDAAHCVSTAPDAVAVQPRAIEDGGLLGKAIGRWMMSATQGASDTRSIQRPEDYEAVRRFCAKHPGQDWHRYVVGGRMIGSGTCPSDEEQAAAVADVFTSKHSDYVRDEKNSAAMVNYMASNRLNPLEEKSLERAYADLKRYGGLALYRKS